MANTKHDNAVRRKINSLRRQGYGRIEAAVPGLESPDPIGEHSRTPDIVATKPGSTKLVELEPEGKVEQHKEQHATFRRHAAQKPRTTFEIDEF